MDPSILSIRVARSRWMQAACDRTLLCSEIVLLKQIINMKRYCDQELEIWHSFNTVVAIPFVCQKAAEYLFQNCYVICINEQSGSTAFVENAIFVACPARACAAHMAHARSNNVFDYSSGMYLHPAASLQTVS